ncbi:hypothetical protein BURMUCGD2M_3265 [Burkholderia multivorans CGD2M]|nr:hypothetical protein BURMUCGD2M_3265 [Burkholderia multivorans CGD2M]
MQVDCGSHIDRGSFARIRRHFALMPVIITGPARAAVRQN